MFLQSDSMEVRKPVLELKDVPPPPLHACPGPPPPPGSLSVSVCSRCAASVQLRQSAGLPLYLSSPHPPGGCGTHCCAHACALHSFPLGDPSSPPHSLHAHCLRDLWRKVCGSIAPLRCGPRLTDLVKHTCSDPAVQSDTSLLLSECTCGLGDGLAEHPSARPGVQRLRRRSAGGPSGQNRAEIRSVPTKTIPGSLSLI